MSFRLTCIGVVMAVLELTANARPLPGALERARYMEDEQLGGCIGPSYPSKVYAAFKWVVQHFSSKELLALLHHPSAVVRAYAVQHFAAQLPAHSNALLPLLADAKTVLVLPAEFGGRFVIDQFVADQLCKHASVPAIKQALRRAASRSDVRPPIRYKIRCCSMDPPADDLLLDIPPASSTPAQPQ